MSQTSSPPHPTVVRTGLAALSTSSSGLSGGQGTPEDIAILDDSSLEQQQPSTSRRGYSDEFDAEPVDIPEQNQRAQHHPSTLRAAAAAFLHTPAGHRASLRDLGGAGGFNSPVDQGSLPSASAFDSAANRASTLAPSDSDSSPDSDDSDFDAAADELAAQQPLARVRGDDSDDEWYTSDDEEDEEPSEAPDDELLSPASSNGPRSAGILSPMPQRPRSNSTDTLNVAVAGVPDARKSPVFFARHRRLRSHRRRQPSYAHLFPSPDAGQPVPPIEAHGVIGNLLTCALVSTCAEIDWLCYPHFDSPPIFHRLLDAQHGGVFRITPASEIRPHSNRSYCSLTGLALSPANAAAAGGAGVNGPHAPHTHRCTTKQLYLHETNCLLTRFFTDGGVGHVTDYMPLGAYADAHRARGWIVRELEVVRGKMYFEVSCTPAFDFGRVRHHVELLPIGALFRTPHLSMLLTSSRQRLWKSIPGGGVRTKVKLEEGQRVVFVLREWREEVEHAKWQDAKNLRELVERQRVFLQEQIARMQAEELASAGKREAAAAITTAAAEESDPAVSPIRPPADVVVSDLRVPPLPTPEPTKGVDGPSSSEQPPFVPSSQLTPSDSSKPSISSHPHKPRRGDTNSNSNSNNDQHEHFGLHVIRPITARRTNRLRKRTVDFWRDWLEPFTYTGRWREIVRRAVLMLKLMTFEPTGAIIQAPTCCLPTVVGVAGLDLRNVSLRDASFTVCAFLKLGFRQEASAWMHWLSARCAESQEADGQLQLLYGLRGEQDLTPQTVTDVPGYKNSPPVTTGNPCAKRVAIDHYGAMLVAIYVSNKYAEPISYELWRHTRMIVQYVADHWRDPVAGLWPEQDSSPPRHYVAAKLMCWVAIDRGIRLAQERSFPAPLPEWKAVRNEIYSDIQSKGFNVGKGYFTQAYENINLDASLLLLPITTFVAPTDPKLIATLEAMLKSTSDDGLLSHSLLHRYNTHPPPPAPTSSSDDAAARSHGNHHGGAVVPQSTTTIASFWAIEACTRGGLGSSRHLERARMLMEQMLGYANHLGLHAEGISPRGEFAGNFPHVLTHVALIRAAIYLDQALNSKRGTPLDAPMFQAQPSSNMPRE